MDDGSAKKPSRAMEESRYPRRMLGASEIEDSQGEETLRKVVQEDECGVDPSDPSGGKATCASQGRLEEEESKQYSYYLNSSS
jgi:hypothetical protein